MAIGSPPFPDIPPIAGFQLAAGACGVKADGADDLLIVRMDPPAAVAGLFTRNQVVAAPVMVCRNRLPEGRAEGLLVNSGNANAGTGPQGMLDALTLVKALSDAFGAPDEHIFIASTGVIGEPLPVARIREGIARLAPTAAASPSGDSEPRASGPSASWLNAARAISTTDTFPKGVFRTFDMDGVPVRLAGIAKGAGMIHPDMATMLAYLFTDAAIAPAALQRLLERAVADSFNAITVDGDTSTNDTVMAFASGMAGNDPITDPDDPRAAPLAAALCDAARELALLIVRDGEGATKLITIETAEAATVEQARAIGKTVAGSLLVKTAFFGADANWGRILAAVGRAGVELDLDQVRILLGGVPIVRGGGRDPDYREELGAAVMRGEEITVRILLGQGSASATVWTCDLSHEYVTINGDYRT